MIEVKNLTKVYGDHIAVNDLSFRIESGHIYGFLGPNGAGKSTTMNMITGCLAPTNGEIFIDGKDIYGNGREVKKLIGYLPEIPPVYPDMTPEEYLTFVAEAKGLKSPEKYEQVYSVMEETGLISRKDRIIKNLSKGYRQRVGIAQAMLGDPKIIIFDEPTVGLDPKQITEIRRLIVKLGQTRTIILSSHILSEVSEICDRVMIISGGRLVASDTLDNIRRGNSPENKVMITVKCGREAVEQILNGIDGAEKWDITEGIDEGTLDVSIDAVQGCDIREALFFKFAESRIAVRKLVKPEPTLEEIFLKLTDTAQYDDSGDENGDDGSDTDDGSENAGGDYVPQFTANDDKEAE